MQIAMIQDKIVPAKELEPVYFDRGMFFGDGVYEVMRSYNGKIFASICRDSPAVCRRLK